MFGELFDVECERLPVLKNLVAIGVEIRVHDTDVVFVRENSHTKCQRTHAIIYLQAVELFVRVVKHMLLRYDDLHLNRYEVSLCAARDYVRETGRLFLTRNNLVSCKADEFKCFDYFRRCFAFLELPCHYRHMKTPRNLHDLFLYHLTSF